ncbi:MAG: hemerythrin family protein [Woeseia sp.]
MSFLKWKDEYSVGVQSMDDEHRHMIELINDVYEELRGHPDADSIEQFLGDVYHAIAAHFALEERLMREAAYAEYAAHKEDHEELLDQIRDMMDSVSRNGEQGLAMLEQRLSAWFGNHFATFDARLHHQLEVH